MSERLYVLIFKKDFDFPEVLSGLLMLGWGVQLLMPWDTFASAAGYRAMATIMPELAWGAVLAWIGFTQIGAYLLDHWRVRLLAALGACMAWAFMAVLFVIVNPYGASVVMYPGATLMSAWVFWRILMAREAA